MEDIEKVLKAVLQAITETKFTTYAEPNNMDEEDYCIAVAEDCYRYAESFMKVKYKLRLKENGTK